MDTYCRVCSASESCILQSLFQICESEDEVIANMIIDCTEVMVSDDDGLPQNICNECLIKLKNAYQLRKQCLKSDALFRQILKSQKIYSDETAACSKDDSKHHQTAKLETHSLARIDDKLNQLFLCDSCGVLSDNNEDMLKHIRIAHVTCETAENLLMEYSGESDVQQIEYLDEVADEFKSSVTGDNALSSQNIYIPDLFVKNVEDMGCYKVYNVIGKRCCVCYQLFDNASNLKLHCGQHHSKSNTGRQISKYSCSICFTTFENDIALDIHLQNMKLDNAQLYHCKTCDMILAEEDQFIAHVISNNDHDTAMAAIQLPERFCEETMEEDQTCSCSRTSKTETIAHREIEKLSTNITIKCNECCKTLTSRNMQHILDGSLQKIYRCCSLNCNYSTISKREILEHISTNGKHDTPEKRTKKLTQSISCCVSRCYQKFSTYKALKHHSETIHKLSRIKHTQERTHSNLICEICLRGFPHEQAYMRHRVADRQQKHICLSCGARYVSKSNLIQHEQSQCGKLATFACSQCDKCFFTAGGLKNHEKLHNNKRSYVCNQCGRSFLRKGVLKEHVNTVHSDVRLFKCTLCPKSFSSKNVFLSHRLTHTKEKPFQCRYCEKRYRKTSDRTLHENQIHLGIRPFQCHFCSAAFIRDRERRLHERTHTKAKLYTCEDCGEGYDKFAEFKQHRQQHHGKETLREVGRTERALIYN
ncbi:oocyte zinc finger protein XlCOF6-like [Wyeomyia smithii]|uniref:oocyte zinc finger protein XlCOF6-like n=1 Tax=Wyeomyia smithii TaxID=174621 RepID=UPI0024680EB6|nr:oocyte zinc finger protein XlCOF6-like [Wyeomyia smithii]